MVLGEVEETALLVDIDEDTGEENIRVCRSGGRVIDLKGIDG